MSGCGDDSEPALQQPDQSSPAATEVQSTPQGTVTDPLSATSTNEAPTETETTSTNPEDQPGGAGDEEPIRVPAVFTFRSGEPDPASVTVPAFLAIELTVVSGDGKPHKVVLDTPEPQTIEVPASGRESVQLDGLKAGTYDLRSVDGNGTNGMLVVGGEPGP